MLTPRGPTVIHRHRGDGRRLTRLSHLLRRVGAPVAGDEYREIISAARRAAELILAYWPKVYARYLRTLPVTPNALYATVYLFLELADGRLMDLAPHWDERVDTVHPFQNFRRRLHTPNPGAMERCMEATATIWEPEPVVYGIDLEWMGNVGPSEHFALHATLWKLWKNNPMYISLMGLIGVEFECLVEGAALHDRILALEPLPAFHGAAATAFWAALGEVELGTDAAHPVSLGDALAYPLCMTENQFANTSSDELRDNYDGNYGIGWNDPEHVAFVGAQQEIGRAIVNGFWELNDVAVAHPPFIADLAAALHAIAADVRAQHPGPDLAQIQADLAQIRARMRADPSFDPYDDQEDTHDQPAPTGAAEALDAPPAPAAAA